MQLKRVDNFFYIVVEKKVGKLCYPLSFFIAGIIFYFLGSSEKVSMPLRTQDLATTWSGHVLALSTTLALVVNFSTVRMIAATDSLIICFISWTRQGYLCRVFLADFFVWSLVVHYKLYLQKANSLTDFLKPKKYI